MFMYKSSDICINLQIYDGHPRRGCHWCCLPHVDSRPSDDVYNVRTKADDNWDECRQNVSVTKHGGTEQGCLARVDTVLNYQTSLSWHQILTHAVYMYTERCDACVSRPRPPAATHTPPYSTAAIIMLLWVTVICWNGIHRRGNIRNRGRSAVGLEWDGGGGGVNYIGPTPNQLPPRK